MIAPEIVEAMREDIRNFLVQDFGTKEFRPGDVKSMLLNGGSSLANFVKFVPDDEVSKTLDGMVDAGHLRKRFDNDSQCYFWRVNWRDGERVQYREH